MFNKRLDQIKMAIVKGNRDQYLILKATADYLLENKVRFIGNWDMERCEDLVDLGDFDWGKMHKQDPEWTFMVNRQEYLMTLLVAYIVERDGRYLEKLKEFILKRMEKMNLVSKLDNKTRTLDTGIRIGVWTRLLTYRLIPGFLSESEVDQIKQSILNQIQFLYNNFEDGYYISNWGLIQAACVLEFSACFENELDPDVEGFFSQALEKNIDLSIFEDGGHWEQSIMYHVEVFISLLRLARVNQVFYNKHKKTLYQMVEYIIGMTHSNFEQVALGDSDVTDTRDVVTAAAIMFQEGAWKPFAYSQPDIDSLLMFSQAEIQAYQNLACDNRKQKESVHFQRVGQVAIKDGATSIIFKNGPLGNGHSHSDLNSLCLTYQNQPIFIDSGRATYMENQSRYYLKSALAHSSLMIDGECPEIIASSWAYDRYPEPIFLNHTHEHGFDYIQSGLLGQIKTGTYTFIRHFVKVQNLAFFILDQVLMAGQHEASLGFILDPAIHYQAGKLGPLNILDSSGFELKATMISKKYNQVQAGHKIVKKLRFQDRLLHPTILYGEGVRIKPMDVFQLNHQPAAGAYGWQIEGADGRFLLALFSQTNASGISVHKIGRHLFRGKCLIIDEKSDKIYRLKN